MNILLTNSGGPDSPGLPLIREAIGLIHRAAKVTILVPENNRPSRGAWTLRTDLSRYLQDELLKPAQDDIYTLEGSTSDCIDFAHLHQDVFLTRPTPWDLIVVGVDEGQATGVPDALQHTSAASGLYAAQAYGAAAHVLLQNPKGNSTDWSNTSQLLNQSLRNVQPGAGETYITNIPPEAIGEKFVPLAHYSSFRTAPPTIVPRARNEVSAQVELQKGHLTHSRAVLRLNPELRY